MRTGIKHTLIVTYGRSGSTLLQGLLNTIDGWIVKGENYNFVYYLFRSYQTSMDAKAKSQMALTPEDPWYGAAEFDPEQYLATVRQIIDDVLLGGRDRSEIVCCGFKEIRYLDLFEDDKTGDRLEAYLDFLLTCLTPCQLIFLSRNLDEIAASGWWQKHNNKAVLKNLLHLFDKFCAKYAVSRPNECFCIDYADLTQSSQRLSEMFEFLQVAPDDDRIRETLETPHSYDPAQKRLQNQ